MIASNYGLRQGKQPDMHGAPSAKKIKNSGETARLRHILSKNKNMSTHNSLKDHMDL